MKSLSLIAIAAFLSVSVLAQTPQNRNGIYLSMGARTNNVVETPTIGEFQPEIGLMTRHFGISFIGYTNSKFETKKVLAYGAKVYAPLFHVDALTFTAAGEALYLDNERRAWRKWAFTPSFGVSTPIFGGFVGEFAILGFTHREVFKASRETPGAKGIIDRWRICEPGASFTLRYQLTGKKKKPLLTALR